MPISKNLIATIGIVLLLIAIPVTIYLVRQQQILKSRASGGQVAFTLTPATGNVAPGATFQVDLKIEAGTDSLSSAIAKLTFSPTQLRITAFQPATGTNTLAPLDENPATSFATPGVFNYQALSVGAAATGTINLGKITFEALSTAPVGTVSTIAFDTTTTSVGGNIFIASTTIPATYIIGTSTASPEPLASGAAAICNTVYDAMRAAFLSSCGDANYNKHVDINKDRMINLLDYNILRNNFSNANICQSYLNDPVNPCATASASLTPTASPSPVGSPAPFPATRGNCVSIPGFFICPIMGRVYLDNNQNGVMDSSEVGVGGVTANIYSDNNGQRGGVIATVTTPSTGDFAYGTLGTSSLNFWVGITTPSSLTTTFTNSLPNPRRLTLTSTSGLNETSHIADIGVINSAVSSSPIASATPVTSGPCTITSVTWVTPNNATTVDRGTTVTMSAQGSGNCSGKLVTFRAFKANGSLASGCNIGGQTGAPTSSIPFDSTNKATTTWVTPFPLSAQQCGPVIDGGPVQYGLGVIIHQQAGEVFATTNLKVREPIPNKVRVTSAASQGACYSKVIAINPPASVRILDYPTIGNIFTQVDWDITQDAPGFGTKVICALFGYKPADSTVTDYQSYPPVVFNTLNYQPLATPSPTALPTPPPSMTTSCTALYNLWLDTFRRYLDSNAVCAQNYNKIADINKDGRISLVDFNTFLTRSTAGTNEQACITMLTDSADACPASSTSPSPSPSASTVAGCTPKPNGDADGNGKTEVLTTAGLQGDFFIWKNAYLGAYAQRADFNCNGTVEVLKSDGTQGDFFIWKNAYLAAP